MLEGHLLNERYRIKQTIGGGGMANVYLAHDLILNRDVAIKVLRLEYANDPEFIERFDREAQAATSLSHPNIVNIYDVGEQEHILYMVMEFVDGLTLKEYIMQDGALEVEEAIHIMKQLTDAIAHAHANGLIHRDIKPQNILMDENGHVKVTDFGIAIALSATSLTQTNAILGSVHYLSPEQARGGMATKKSDIYSLGIVLYELLTAQLPFSGQSPISIALKHLQNETPSVRNVNPSIPQSVENIVLKATAKDPFHRYENVQEMEEALGLALDPAFLNEALYEPPVEAGEETKAIPIITNEQYTNHDDEGDQTLVHQEAMPTKNIAEQPSNQTSDKKPKKKKHFRKTKWFLLILLLVVVGGLVAFLIIKPGDVQIPDLTGKSYDEAVEELTDLELKVNKNMTFSEEIEIDHIVKTDPTAGRTVKEGTTINLYVSDGKEKEAFDDYVGQNFNQVERLLKEAGYKEVRFYEKTSDEPVGEIITQIQPPAGQEVVPSDTIVIFEISDGPELINLSNLSGLTVSEAEKYAEKYNFTLEKQEKYSDSVDEGIIIDQSPKANTDVMIGSTVSITVSLGRETQPPKSHKVSFTVPFQPKEDEDGELLTEQTVQIYVGDMNEDISNVFHEDLITKDQDFDLTLVIEEGQTAEYKVVRDEEVIIEKKVSYEEGD